MRYLLTLVLLLITVPCQAETFWITGPIAPKYWLVNPDTGRQILSTGPTENATLNLQFDVDWEASTISIGNLLLDQPDGLNRFGTWHHFGNNDVRVEANFEPFQIEFNGWVTLPMKPMDDGSYSILGQATMDTGPLTLYGDWTAVNAVDSTQGLCSITFNEPPVIRYHSLTLTHNAYSLQLHGQQEILWGGGGDVPLVDTIVDGHHVQSGIHALLFEVNSPRAFLVPEPSTLVLLLIGLLYICTHLRLTNRHTHR